jgi:hypothetical protein
MRGWAAVSWVLGVAWLAFACGSSEHSPGTAAGGTGGNALGEAAGTNASATAGNNAAAGSSTATPIELPDLCPIFTHDLCVYLMECNGARYRDAAHCERELSCFGLPQLTAAAAAGAVEYNPKRVGECHEFFMKSPCTFGFFLSTPDIYDVLQFCPGTITPKLTAGAACSANGECSAGLYCDKGSTHACPGTCKPFAQQGESCAGSASCADELSCADGVCVPRTKAGDSCTDFCSSSVSCLADQVCPENVWCDKATSKCTFARLEGEPCGATGSGTTASTADCAVNLWCDKIGNGAGTCHKPSALGGPCNRDEFSACAEDLHCVGYTPAGTAAALGTCQPPGPAGTDCQSRRDCETGLTCVASHCQTPGLAGATCNSNGDCAADLVCSDNECAAARYPGDACDDGRCTGSRCINGTCDYHAQVGEACAAAVDCATGACVDGHCYDNSVCKVPTP